MITLYNVIDVRTGLHHSVAIVKERFVRFYKPVLTEEEEQ